MGVGQRGGLRPSLLTQAVTPLGRRLGGDLGKQLEFAEKHIASKDFASARKGAAGLRASRMAASPPIR